MARIAWIAVLWAGSVVGAWFLGGGGGAPREPAEVPALEGRHPPAATPAAPGEGAPVLAGREATADEGPPRGGPPAGAPSVTPAFHLPRPAEPVISLDPESLGSNPDEAMGRLMSYAQARLAEGEKGHLELLAALGGLLKDGRLEALFGSDESAVRYLYPWLKFLVQHDLEVAGMTETVFRTMAERPEALAGLDDDVLEMFTEGFAMALPAVLPEDRLERLRDHARRISSTPEDALPQNLRRSRGDMARALAAWTPPLTPEQALERLRAGRLDPREALPLMGRLSAQQLAEVDVAAILGPLLESGDWRALRALRGLALDARTLGALDEHAYAGASPENPWWVGQYLSMSGRDTWEEARPFIDGGLRRGGRTQEVMARALLNLSAPPPADYVADLLRSYDLPEEVQSTLRARFRLDESGRAPR